MSDIINIKQLSLEQENQVLKEQVLELEKMLSFSARLPAPEEMICIEQIDILRSASAKRELSLDEVKRLDLLIKNLRLLREQSTQVIESVDYTNMKEADLVAAITSPDQINK